MSAARGIAEYAPSRACSLDELEAMARGLAATLGGPSDVWVGGRVQRGALQTEASSDVLRVSGALGGRRVVLRYRELDRPEADNLFGTTVDVAVDVSPIRLDLTEGWSAGPRLPTPLPGHCLRGTPRELVLALLDAETTARLAAHHATELRIGSRGLTLAVTGWVDDAPSALALLALANGVADRATAVIESAIRARTEAVAGGDPDRARAELRAAWNTEAADWQAATERSGRRAGALALALLGAIVLIGVVAAIVLASR